MPTESVKIVDPDNGSGTNYTSLSAWEAGEQADLVTNDRIAVAKCRSTGGSADTTPVTIAGWTTSSSCYIKIWTDPSDTGGDGQGGSYRHLGKWPSSGQKIYRLDVGSNGSGIKSAQSGTLYWRAYGLAIKSAAGAGSTNAPILQSSDTEYGYFGYCYLETTSSGSSFRMNCSGTSYLFNTILTGSSYYAHGTNTGVYTGYYGTLYVYNCTCVRGGYSAYARVYGSLYCYNCIGEKNSSSSENAFSSITGGDYNISNDSSAPGSNSIKNTTLTYVNRSNKDFHLASTDTAAINAGQYNPASGLYSDDIDGQSRGTSNWDIGADEYVASGTTVNVGKQDLTLSILQATVSISVSASVSVGKQDISLNVLQASASTSQNVSISAGKQDVTLGIFPAALVSSSAVVATNKQDLAISVRPATVAIDCSLGTSKQDLSLDVKSATASTEAAQNISAGKQDLALSVLQASVSITSQASVSANKQDLIFSIFSALAFVDCNVAINKQDLALAAKSASVSVDQIIEAAKQNLQLLQHSVGFIITHNIQIGTQSLAWIVNPAFISVAIARGELNIVLTDVLQPMIGVREQRPIIALN